MKKRNLILAMLIAGLQPVSTVERATAEPAAKGLSMEDMSALLDAKISGLKAGLKLTAAQEKFWPPVEA